MYFYLLIILKCKNKYTYCCSYIYSVYHTQIIEFIEEIFVCRALYRVMYLLSVYIEWRDVNGLL